MKVYLKYSLLSLTVSQLMLLSCSNKFSKGQYRGIEVITVTTDKKYWPGVYNLGEFTDSTEKWFHEVTISLKDQIFTIVKKPFKMNDGKRLMSDSTGGFYYYSGKVLYSSDSKHFTIFINLDSCKFCPRLATAVPRYTSTTYDIKSNKTNWIVDTEFEKGVIFKRL